MVMPISKRRIIRAASCLPIFPKDAVLSDVTMSRIRDHVSGYANEKRSPWNYGDLPNHIWSLYQSSSLEGVLSSVARSPFETEVASKTKIVSFLAQEMPPSGFEPIEFKCAPRILEEDFAFSPPYDVVLKSGEAIHCMFVNPYAEIVLKDSQRQLLQNSLSQMIEGYSERLVLEYFEFPKLGSRRSAIHLSTEFGYFDIDDVLAHFRRFQIEEEEQEGGSLFN